MTHSSTSDDLLPGQLTTNVMYGVGDVTGMTIYEETAILASKAYVTGLGAGANLPFKVVAHKGGLRQVRVDRQTVGDFLQ